MLPYTEHSLLYPEDGGRNFLRNVSTGDSRRSRAYSPEKKSPRKIRSITAHFSTLPQPQLMTDFQCIF
jgi:hypothetical protein